MQEFIKQFVEQVKSGEVEVYNEFSLQHELGIFLRERLNPQKADDKMVQFERNVCFFEQNKDHFIKKEMDICIFKKPKEKPYKNVDPKKTYCEAIELKFPHNGQYPEQMFSFCKDIQFLEELLKAGFKKAYLVIFANERPFYSGNCVSNKGNKIYSYFRGDCKEPLTGRIKKPTGKKDQELHLEGTYQVEWHDITEKLKYAIIEAKRTS